MTTPLHPIRLLIADDHPLLRAGLRQVIATDPRLQIGRAHV